MRVIPEDSWQGVHQVQGPAQPTGKWQIRAPPLHLPGLCPPHTCTPGLNPAGKVASVLLYKEESQLRRIRDEPGSPSAPELSTPRTGHTHLWGPLPGSRQTSSRCLWLSTVEGDPVQGTLAGPGLAGSLSIRPGNYQMLASGHPKSIWHSPKRDCPPTVPPRAGP